MLGLGTCFCSWFSYPVALALNIVIVWFLVSLSIYFTLFPVPSPFSFLSMCFVLFCFFSLFLSIIVPNSLQFVFPHSALNIVGFSSIICSGILSFCRYSLFSIGQPSFYFLSRLVYMVFFSSCVIRSCMASLFFFIMVIGYKYPVAMGVDCGVFMILLRMLSNILFISSFSFLCVFCGLLARAFPVVLRSTWLLVISHQLTGGMLLWRPCRLFLFLVVSLLGLSLFRSLALHYSKTDSTPPSRMLSFMWIVLFFSVYDIIFYSDVFVESLYYVPVFVLDSFLIHYVHTLIARFMGPTWCPSGADRTQVGPMLAKWTLLSGYNWSWPCLVVWFGDV